MTGTKEECLHFLISAEDGAYEVKKLKKKRSLTSNAYYWVLLGKLSSTLRTSDLELHRGYIEQYAPTIAPITVKADIDLSRMEAGYFFPLKKSLDGEWQAWLLKKGTSDMTQEEFSRLLDHVVEDCNMMHIPTLTEKEMRRLAGYVPKHNAE